MWLSISEAISSARRDCPVSARHHDLTCASMSGLLRLRGQHVTDGYRQALPFLPLGLQLLAPRGGQAVVLGLALVFAFAPLGGDPAAVLQPVQPRIERPLRDLQRVLRDLLDAQQDAVAVQRPE